MGPSLARPLTVDHGPRRPAAPGPPTTRKVTTMLRDARVATIVLNYRHTEDTVACLTALQRSTCLDQRFVVVDNAAPGPEHDALRAAVTAATAPAADVAVVASGGNLGYAAGNNLGIRLALGLGPPAGPAGSAEPSAALAAGPDR